jgi:hypothetical protein
MKTKIITWSLLIYWPFIINPLTVEKNPMALKNKKNDMKEESLYNVGKLKENTLKIDADWDKPQWQDIESIEIKKQMGNDPKFLPKVRAKLMYDDENVYGIFLVEDRYVRSVVQEYNGNVSGDSCVEFFFSPDSNFPERYFNLEINAGGTPLMFYITKPWDEFTKLKEEDIQQIEIAHSLPAVVDPEITEPVTWTIEYRIPLDMLEKYSNVTRPSPGTIWKANFYKTGSKTSNPNYLTWSFVDYPKPNFHVPQSFGSLKFQ